MSEDAFFQDLAMLMVMAGIVAACFSRFRFPKVLGYIFAGILMSEYTWGGSFLINVGSVRIIGEIGIVLLMLTMGLAFSPARIREVRSTALPVAIVDTVVMTWLGYTIGTRVFGWSYVPSLFLGVAICDSATTMLGKTIDELKWGAKPFVSRAIGTSICEDLICVGMIALITGVAQTGQMSLASAGVSLGGLAVFIGAVIVIGFVNVPRLLQSVSKKRDDESLLLSVLGCCFFVSFVAFKFDFSLAIGAFLVGVIAATSDLRYRISSLVEPLKTMFAAVFFISIGLLVDPETCIRLSPQILLLTAVVMIGKFLNCTISALVCGESLKTSVQVGMSMAQIGEFAFMVALMYLGLTGDAYSPMYQITVAVSLLTTIANPFMIRASEPFGEWLERRLGSRVLQLIDDYRGFVSRCRNRAAADNSVRWQLRRDVGYLVFLGLLQFAFSVAMRLLARRDWSDFSETFERYDRLIFFAAVNLSAATMIAPIVVVTRRLGGTIASLFVGEASAGWREAVTAMLRHTFTVVGVAVFFVFMAALNVNLAPDQRWARWTIFGIFVLIAIIGWKRSLKNARIAIERFQTALAVDERMKAEEGKAVMNAKMAASVVRIEVGSRSQIVGETPISLNIRARTGVSVVSVERNGNVFTNPGGDWKFAAGDVVLALGSAEQIDAFRTMIR